MNVQAARQKIVSKEPVQIHQSQFAVARVLPRLLMHLHAKRMLLAVEVNNVLFQKSFPRLEQKNHTHKTDNCAIFLIFNTL